MGLEAEGGINNNNTSENKQGHPSNTPTLSSTTTTSTPTSKINAPVDDDLLTLPGHLVTTEFFWRDHHTSPKDRGYTLRPRYAPVWVPSWEQQEAGRGAPAKLFYCREDGQMSAVSSNVLDATRISDGAYMSLEAVEKSLHPDEAEIGLFLSKEPLESEIHNHCVPVLLILQVPDDQDRIIIVMPMLRRYDNPRFDTFGEAVDFFRQVFEGMQFMHRHHVALRRLYDLCQRILLKDPFRDCMALNIMMDLSKLYPKSYDPRRIDQSRDFSGTASHTTRTKQPPKYYFIDFVGSLVAITRKTGRLSNILFVVATKLSLSFATLRDLVIHSRRTYTTLAT
ncbi:hypothetical protein PILCRDRAFT_13130 [Piloderma croceum F 1598]|uniref:Protein kinase domain-containing protein n=1 Tax=Piloderma croceum (strain F 1598) TaxID=765440 RepID=A0A0C3APS8_PILCF|nr:hypothetical protein PILCRDRAFT_13130 [Piloderma croceum F 1598]